MVKNLLILLSNHFVLASTKHLFLTSVSHFLKIVKRPITVNFRRIILWFITSKQSKQVTKNKCLLNITAAFQKAYKCGLSEKKAKYLGNISIKL